MAPTRLKSSLPRRALAGAAAARIQLPDSGSVDTDAYTLARAVQAILSVPEGAAVTRALIAGAMSSPEIADVMQRFWAGRQEAISVSVDRAIGRDQLPPGTDAAAFLHALAAPLYYQLLVTRAPVTEHDAELTAAAALAAAAAGIFVLTR
ncbi:MAG: TetR-like C-terminal domain-containing protein [Streptosporangiaceae bacterium]